MPSKTHLSKQRKRGALALVLIVFLFGLFTVSLWSFPTNTGLAQITKLSGDDCSTLGINCSEKDNAGTLETYALTIINVFLGLVGVLALIFVILGGVMYVTAHGDEGQAENAKKTILYAVIGVVLIGLAAIIVNFTLGATGIDSSVPGGSDLVGSILAIINWFLVLGGVTALIFVLYGGVQYMTAAGDDSKAESAKKTILYAVIGLIVIGLAAVTVNFTAAAVGLGTGIPATNALPGAILTLVNIFLILAGIVALIVLIIAGLQYIMARGDEEQAKTAQKTILYAVIGLIVIGLAAVTVNFVISVLVLA